MATNTPNYSFKKPGYTDPVDINDINGNFDKVDTELKSISDSFGIWSGSNVRGIETIYTGDNLTTVKEKDASNGVITQTTLAYHPDGRVNTVTEVIGGTTYLTTLNYVNGDLDPANPVTRSVI